MASSSISARLTPAAGSVIAPPATPEEEAARLVAEADSFLRFGLAKKAIEHLREALEHDASLRPVRERLAKLYEAQRDYKAAIAELRVLLSQCSEPQEEVRYLREILRLDNQDQAAERRLRVITGMHYLPSQQVGRPAYDDFDEPEISVSSGDERQSGGSSSSLSSSMATTSEVPIAEFKKYMERMKAEASQEGLKPQKPAAAQSSVSDFDAFEVSPDPTPSASTRPNAAEVEAAAEELALTSGTLKEELDEVDFCLQQKMYDDARRQLQALASRYPHSKTVAAKLKQLENPHAEVVIDVDMADVHEELILSVDKAPPGLAGTPGRSFPPPIPTAAPSGRSMQTGNHGAVPTGPSGMPQTPSASQRSVHAPRRSLPPPPPRPSRQLKTLASSDTSGAFRLGVSYRNRGQFEQAITEFEKALGDAKRGARAALMTGLCYRDQNRIKQAIEVFKLGIHMPDVNDTDLHELYYQLGRSYELLGDSKEAIHFYQNAIRKDGRFRDSVERIAALQQLPNKK